MAKDIEKQIDNISTVVQKWLSPDNIRLKKAIDQTVEERLFTFEDVKHQILTLKNTLKREHLMNWVQRAGITYQPFNSKRILCLHAGNLPLVGIQDLLAVLLTGGEYVGKLSKKDPYLLQSFLDLLAENGYVKQTNYSTDIGMLPKKLNDALLFAGSEDSANNIYDVLRPHKLLSNATPVLMRTAHFSIAFIEDDTAKTMEDLTEAVFRFGGTGCRSVAMVVAPYHLNSSKCEFTDYIEAFWIKNPQLKQPDSSLDYRYACNKALDIEQAWLNDFLIEETVEYPEERFILHWIKGDFETLKQLTQIYGRGLQSVYSTSRYIGENVNGKIIEPLSRAQTPPIWWKPDGTDTLEWLQNHIS